MLLLVQVRETAEFGFGTSTLGDCVQGPEFATATGEIQAGESQECIFSNFGSLKYRTRILVTLLKRLQ